MQRFTPDTLCAGLQEGCPSSCSLICLALYIKLQHEHADLFWVLPVLSSASCM